MGAAGLTCGAANGDTGTGFNFDCLGFFGSRLLRCCPLGMLFSRENPQHSASPDGTSISS